MIKKENLANGAFCVVLLTMVFFTNFMGVAKAHWFSSFQRGSESLIIGRLATAEREGIFSKGALTGRYVIEKLDAKRDERVDYQYDIYENNLKVEAKKFSLYRSQTGGQAIMFALLDRILPFSNKTNYKIFQFITSLLTAVVFTFFLLWVKQKHGLLSATITLLLIVISPWLIVFGRNLWWSLWAFYIPFLFILELLEREFSEPHYSLTVRKIVTISFFAVLLKCYFTGFEYITTTLLMFATPLLYYAISAKWPIITLVKRVMYTAIGSIVAMTVSTVILVYQLFRATGSLQKGMNHIIYSYGKRTSGNADDFPEVYRRSLESSVGEVLTRYFGGKAFHFGEWFNISFSFMKIQFWQLFLFIFVCSIITLLLRQKSNETTPYNSENRALIITCWVSILAPLSWYVIFKGHSYIHGHMNYIVWYMPFLLFGFTVVGNATTSVFERIRTLSKKRKQGLI